nr:MAG: hypothetical protein [Microvirus sp.]
MKVFRKSVRKGSSVRKFRRGAEKTKVVNLRSAPQRGGWRL